MSFQKTDKPISEMSDFDLARHCIKLSAKYVALIAEHSTLRADLDERRGVVAGEIFATRERLLEAEREIMGRSADADERQGLL